MTMKSAIIAALAGLTLVACSTAHQHATLEDNGHNFCYVDETIKSKDGELESSETVMRCSDKPRVEHFMKDVGKAQECRNYYTSYRMKGQTRHVKGLLCKFPNGEWQAVDQRYSYFE